jgi:serine/threonine protein kinase
MSTLRTDAEGHVRLPPGEVIADRFTLDRAAGSGGMGTVYRAHDAQSATWVALKLLHQKDGRDHHPDRFLREAQLLSELRHPHIVRYIAHGQTPQGQCFLAMQWLDGQDLAQRLQSGPIPIRDTLTMTARIADALAHAHQHGIVHRDHAPKNKLCSPAGHTAIQRRRNDPGSPLRTHQPQLLAQRAGPGRCD